MYYTQIASGVTGTFVFIELWSFVLGAGNVFVCQKKKSATHIVSSVDIINTEHVYTKVSFVFHIFWFPKISQFTHFIFNTLTKSTFGPSLEVQVF